MAGSDPNDTENKQLAKLQRSLDRMSDLLAKQSDQLDQVYAMLRRREDQLKRSEAEVRRLRKQLGLDPDPEPDAAPLPDEAPSDDDELGGDDTSQTTAESSDPSACRASEDEGSDATNVSTEPKPRGRSGGRRPPPEHLATEVEHHAACACARCGAPTFKRDVLVTNLYTVVPEHVRRRQIRRERTICSDPDCGAATTAPMPPMPCHRTLYDCSFLAWLVVMKFVLLVPLDRVRTHLQSQGIDLAMGTLVRLIERAVHLADAVDGEHWRQLMAGSYLCFDGTGLKVLVDGQGKAWDGYLEVFTRDVLTVFQFSLTKHADGLRDRMRSFPGTVVCDAESRNLAGLPDKKLLHCNAHPLRKLEAAEKVQPELGAEALEFLREVFRLQKEAEKQGLVGDDLVAFRRRRSLPVLQRFRRWLEGVMEQDLPMSDPVRRVAAYYLKHFENLTRFVDRADLPLDNNAAEREFQRHAKLRHASLFAGSPEGAHRWATLLGVVRTAQKCDVDVQAYLTWMFERRGTHRRQFAVPVAELTPMAFKQQLEETRAACA